jgi:integrase
MAKRLPAPYKYRGKWRGTVTMAAGRRPTRDFEKYEDAKSWIVSKLNEKQAASGHEPKLGGPTGATVAEALNYYAHQLSVNKGGFLAELNRINRYLRAGGFEALRMHVNETGIKSLVVATAKESQDSSGAFEAYSDKRRALRPETYGTIGKLATRRCSSISTADIREFMSTMAREGLSPSTIQKEIALLKHIFNTAVLEWSWTGFKNPCLGLKLGKSATRFVVLSNEQVHTLMQAAAGCDNPLVPAAIGLALDSAMRKGSLLSLDWATISLENRTLMVGSKTGDQTLALSQTTVAILNNLPKKTEGRVLPLSSNALDMAWEGVREKAGLRKLQFRDLRHVTPTQMARQGMAAHLIQRMLGHKTINMAQAYVNLVQLDMVEVLDKLAPLNPILVLEPLSCDSKDEIRRRRSDRITSAIRQKAQASLLELTGLAAVGQVTPNPDTTPAGSQEATPLEAQTETESRSMEVPSADELTTPAATPLLNADGFSANVLRVDFRARKVANGSAP